MKYLLDLINAITPFMIAGMPLWMMLGGWWIKRQADKQTEDLKSHSDENREKIKDAVVSSSGTFKAPDSGP